MSLSKLGNLHLTAFLCAVIALMVSADAASCQQAAIANISRGSPLQQEATGNSVLYKTMQEKSREQRLLHQHLATNSQYRLIQQSSTESVDSNLTQLCNLRPGTHKQAICLAVPIKSVDLSMTRRGTRIMSGSIDNDHAANDRHKRGTAAPLSYPPYQSYRAAQNLQWRGIQRECTW